MIQPTLSNTPDIREPQDAECLEIRLRTLLACRTTVDDAHLLLAREKAEMEAAGARYWVCRHTRMYDRLERQRRGSAPEVLIVRGIPDLSVPAVGMVGPRRPDDYGTEMATIMARAVSAAGVTLVSGGAAGIDSIAHETALARGAGTACVMGSGFLKPHPPANADLFERIAGRDAEPGRRRGNVVISEYAPSVGAMQHHFPQRNRIVAALSDAVIVVQAGWGSGAMITARLAIDCGVPVFVVPADIMWASSAASNDLLGRGATAICRPSDLNRVPELAGIDFGRQWPRPAARQPGWKSPWALAGTQTIERLPDSSFNRQDQILNAVTAHFETSGAGIDPGTLATKTGLPFPEVQSGLLMLEIEGKVSRLPGGSFVPGPQSLSG